jgi:hypothetical protein
MSLLAQDLIELNALPLPHGTLTEHLLRAMAMNLIAEGVADERGGL